MADSPVAIIVGASSGIGRATAARLVRDNFRVMAAARRIERLRELEQELAVGADRFLCQSCDVTDSNSVAETAAATVQHFGRIDALIYATGTNIPRRSLDVLSTADWQRLLETNLTGALHCTQSVLPVMRQQKSGLLIYVSTGAVQYPDVSGVAYQASKHGLTGLAYGTRQEEKAHGIRTTLIFPGLCDTEILSQRPVPTPADVLAQALKPDDVASAIAFVAGLDARCHVPELQLFPARI